MSDSIAAHLMRVEKQIAEACSRAGRNPKDVRILLATKTIPPERLILALQQNYRLFGENTAQELVKKQQQLAQQDIEWHFIGRLQTNKVKDVLPRATLIHSLDRLNLAEEIQKRAQKPMGVLIEIHSSGEDSKTGVSPKGLEEFARRLEPMDKLVIQGVMTVAENATDPEKVRQCFRETRKCFEKLKSLKLKNADLKYISMGMSNDFEIAIEEGANLIRLGSVIFGAREYPAR